MLQEEAVRLPLEPNELRGRDRDLKRLTRLLDGGARLVVLVGPPGVGKTRLAIRLARRIAKADAPVLFCDVSSATSLAELVQLLRIRWGLPSGGRPAALPGGDLGHALAASRPRLVVLDNFEHLVDQAAGAVQRWSDAAIRTRFIVTSRTPLHVTDAEVRYEVRPLRRRSAVRLFLDRVGCLCPALELDADDRRSIERIVDRLDRLPLAVELAASRIPVMRPSEILENIDGGMALRDAVKGSVRRFDTLGEAIAWSWRLLADPQRQALLQCLAFAGGFSLEAVPAIVECPEELDPVDLVQQLRESSLVGVQESHGRRTRFRLYQAVSTHLRTIEGSAAQVEAARLRHGRWFVERAEEQAHALDGSGWRAAARWLGDEAENITAAIDYWRGRSPTWQARGTLALDRMLSWRGPFHEQLDHLDRALQRGDGVPRPLLVQLLIARGAALRRSGSLERARGDLDRALALSARRHAALRAGATLALGQVELIAGDLPRASEMLRRARRTALRAGAHAVATSALSVLGEAEGRIDLLTRCLQEAIARGADFQSANTRWHLGRVIRDRGRPSEALGYLEEALAQSRELGESRLEALVLANLGLAQHFAGDAERALASYAAAFALHGRNGHVMIQGWTLTYSGVLEHQLERLGEAYSHLCRAARLARECGDLSGESQALAHLAAVTWHGGAPEEARALLRRARHLAAKGRDVAAPRVVALIAEVVALEPAQLELAPLQGGGRPVDERPRPFEPNQRVSQWVRLAGLALDAMRKAPRRTGPRGQPFDEGVLRVGPDAAWFSTSEGDVVSLANRHPLRRILHRLIEARQGLPSSAVAGDELIAAGWPGERLSAASASNRLRNGVSTLRRLGLRGILLKRTDGYLLDPDRPVRVT